MKKKNNKPSLEDLMNRDASDSLDSSGGLKLSHDKSKRNLVMMAVGLLVAFALVVTGLVFVLTTGKKKTVAKDDTQYVSVAELEAREAAKSGASLGVDKKRIPFKYSKWQRGALSMNDKKYNEVKSETLNYVYGDTDLFSPSLVSEKGKMTRDFKKEYIKQNGQDVENPNWEYWTRELFFEQASDIVERLVNPIVGGWGAYQTTGGKEKFYALDDVMTSQLRSKIQDKPIKDWFPGVFTDDKKAAGLAEDSGILYYGEPQKIDVDIAYRTDILGGHSATVMVEAKYGFYTAERKDKTFTEKFKLTLFPNYDNKYSEQRVLLHDIQRITDFKDDAITGKLK